MMFRGKVRQIHFVGIGGSGMSGIAEVLNAMAPDVTGEFQVVLSHPGPYDALDIIVESERSIGPEAEALKRRIQAEIKRTLGFSVMVQLAPPATIPQNEVGKVARVVRKF